MFFHGIFLLRNYVHVYVRQKKFGGRFKTRINLVVHYFLSANLSRSVLTWSMNPETCGLIRKIGLHFWIDMGFGEMQRSPMAKSITVPFLRIKMMGVHTLQGCLYFVSEKFVREIARPQIRQSTVASSHHGSHMPCGRRR